MLNKNFPILLSILFPGVGQFYCGQIQKGLWQSLFAVALLSPFFLLDMIRSSEYIGLFTKFSLIAAVMMLVLYFFSIIDARRLSRITNERLDILRHERLNQLAFIIIAVLPTAILNFFRVYKAS